MTANRWKCTDCDAIVDQASVLRAQHPWCSEDIVTGCPECHAVDAFVRACGEPDCTRRASIGTPILGGYQHTCWEHIP